MSPVVVDTASKVSAYPPLVLVLLVMTVTLHLKNTFLPNKCFNEAFYLQRPLSSFRTLLISIPHSVLELPLTEEILS